MSRSAQRFDTGTGWSPRRPLAGMARLARLALALAPALLGGCGFAPLYAQDGSSPVADLPAIYVDNIPAGHYGQLVREGLQQRLDSPESGAASRFRLVVGLGTSAAGIAVQPDNSSTFTRIVGTATWTLYTVGIAPVRLASGSARTLDGYNQIDQQYFQSTISGETANNRIAANLADQVTLEVAAWFRSARENGDAALAAAERPPSDGGA